MGLLVIDGTTIMLCFGGYQILKAARWDYWGMGVERPIGFSLPPSNVLPFLFQRILTQLPDLVQLVGDQVWLVQIE